MLCSLQTAVVCPEQAIQGKLTAKDLAALLRIPLRTAQYRIKRWRELGESGLYPRVSLESRPVGGVVCVVDRESYEAWKRGERIAA